MRPAAKGGIVLGGFVAAFAVACGAVYLNQRLTNGPAAQASSGMFALGDLILGIVVFGGFSLLPFGLALYWLRPVERFWTILVGTAVVFVVTGPLALVMSSWLGAAYSIWSLLAAVRLGLMPLSALAMSMGGLFAPQTKSRWILIGLALLEGGIFAGVVLFKFLVPGLSR